MTADGDNITLNGGSQDGMYMTMYINGYKEEVNIPMDGGLSYMTFQIITAAGNKYFFSGVLAISSLTQLIFRGRSQV